MPRLADVAGLGKLGCPARAKMVTAEEQIRVYDDRVRTLGGESSLTNPIDCRIHLTSRVRHSEVFVERAFAEVVVMTARSREHDDLEKRDEACTYAVWSL